MEYFAVYNSAWIRLNERRGVFFSDDHGSSVAASAQDRRPAFRAMSVGGQEVHTVVTEQSIRACLCSGTEFAGNAHGCDLDEDTALNEICHN